MTLLESDPIILDESEFEIPCEGNPQCPTAAEWVIRCRECGFIEFLCGRHLRVVRSWRLWWCDKCKAQSLRFEDIAEVTPLKGNP